MTKARSLSDFIESDGSVTLVDNQKIKVGTGNDLEIYHDGSNSYIQDAGTGTLRILSDEVRIYNAAGNKIGAQFIQDGEARLKFDNSTKLATKTTGVEITGTLDVDVISNASGTVHLNDTLYFQDNSKAVFGDSSDLQIYHDGSNSYIEDAGTGNLSISTNGNGVEINKGVSEYMIRAITDGPVKLYYDNSLKIETTSTGVSVTGDIAVTGTVDGVDISALNSSLSTVATSGAYSDLSGLPTIPTNNNQLTNGAGYVTSSGNTIIGTDSDIDTSGATVVDQLNMTDGVIQSHSTRTMTLADLGYTGATNANYITNNNQLTNGAGFTTYSANQALDTSSAPTFAGLSLNGGGTWGNNHTITQRGQFTTGQSGQNNSAQGAQLSYHYGYQFAGAWTYPYPDVVFGYHTGMRLGAETSYGGTRFYADHPSRTTTILFSVGNGDSHVRATNNIYAYTSDKRLKENFRPIENAVDKVKAIGGFIFDWRKDMMEKHDFTPDQEQDDAGLIAQEVQKVMPAAIKRAPFDHDLTKPNQSKSGEEFLTVQYEKMVPLLVEAIKEQQKQIDELKEKLETK